MTHSAVKYLEKLRKLNMAEGAVYIINDDHTEVFGDIVPDSALTEAAKLLGCRILFFARPTEPFMSAMELASAGGAFAPNDSETRTFLHTIPVLDRLSAEAIAAALRTRKAVFIRGHGIVTASQYTPEQAYIFYSSAVFSGFVKFFSDAGSAAAMKHSYDKLAVRMLINGYIHNMPKLIKPDLNTDIFKNSGTVTEAMTQTGKAVVSMGLVDSFFGNISCLYDNKIYISRTGSSLDELEDETDACPLDESSCVGLTASSELASHRRIYELTDSRVILHAHPRFSVIMSMVCGFDCEGRGQCHYRCDRERFINDCPIVPGEVGNGKRGMVNTMPPAVKLYGCAVVYGHGVFTVSETNFSHAAERLITIESDALDLYQNLAC